MTYSLNLYMAELSLRHKALCLQSLKDYSSYSSALSGDTCMCKSFRKVITHYALWSSKMSAVCVYVYLPVKKNRHTPFTHKASSVTEKYEI